MTSTIEDHKFFLKKNGVIFLTPLFLSLMMIEFSDVIFALDSIPAIFAVTKDPFIVYTTNVFAILGLRSLYFALASIVDKFRFLKYGLALVLVVVGIKMIGNYFFTEHFLPIELTLLFISILLGGTALLSYILPEKKI